jgi:hypothetical protein
LQTRVRVEFEFTCSSSIEFELICSSSSRVRVYIFEFESSSILQRLTRKLEVVFGIGTCLLKMQMVCECIALLHDYLNAMQREYSERANCFLQINV